MHLWCCFVLKLFFIKPSPSFLFFYQKILIFSVIYVLSLREDICSSKKCVSILSLICRFINADWRPLFIDRVIHKHSAKPLPEAIFIKHPDHSERYSCISGWKFASAFGNLATRWHHLHKPLQIWPPGGDIWHCPGPIDWFHTIRAFQIF